MPQLSPIGLSIGNLPERKKRRAESGEQGAKSEGCSIHRRDTEATERYHFVVYRDLPASRLGGATDRRKHPPANPSQGVVPLCDCFGAEPFCLSVSPDKQKLFSVASVPPW